MRTVTFVSPSNAQTHSLSTKAPVVTGKTVSLLELLPVEPWVEDSSVSIRVFLFFSLGGSIGRSSSDDEESLEVESDEDESLSDPDEDDEDVDEDSLSDSDEDDDEYFLF